MAHQLGDVDALVSLRLLAMFLDCRDNFIVRINPRAEMLTSLGERFSNPKHQ